MAHTRSRWWCGGLAHPHLAGRAHPPRAGQLAELPALLARGAPAFGFLGDVWTRARGCPVSPQALEQRFTPQAADLLQDLLATAVQTLVSTEPVAVPLLQRFAGVSLLDSSTVVLPAALAELWPGCGGS